MHGEWYLGRTADGEAVFGELEIEKGNGRIVEFTDHSRGPSPDRLSVTFTGMRKGLAKPWTHSTDTIPDRFWSWTGMFSGEEWSRVTDTSHSELAEDDIAFLYSLAERWHLNTMHAECIHQEKGAGLDSPDCPETGYRYGHKWLAERIPEDILARAIALIEGK